MEPQWLWYWLTYSPFTALTAFGIRRPFLNGFARPPVNLFFVPIAGTVNGTSHGFCRQVLRLLRRHHQDPWSQRMDLNVQFWKRILRRRVHSVHNDAF